MANSLMQFTQQMPGQINPTQLAQRGGMNVPQMLGQIRQFKSMFHGNAKQQVMQMVRQGVRSNEQLNQAMQMAQQFRGLI